ncbi:MAG: hypothetical protein HQL98_15090 [Magnetococcales bacterium]|nr:hypothetical protein [Magnetococcales bacterium]
MAVLLQGGMALATEPASSLRHEVICRKTPSCQMTLMARLPHAPFPYDGMVGDTGQPFFEGMDAAHGQRLHRVSEELSYPESPHYRDNRVLIHLPPQFKPDNPFEIVVFFHGHMTELNRTVVDEMALPDQINATGRNLLLVAPQMVLEGADSSPGKLYRPGGFDNLLQDVSKVLKSRMGKTFAARFDRAPVILTAFSGGFRATAYTLDRGFANQKPLKKPNKGDKKNKRDKPGKEEIPDKRVSPDKRDARLRGVILVDALYSDTEKFNAWLRHPGRRGFFVNLYGPSSAPLSQQLQQEWDQCKLPWSERLKGKIKPKGLYSLSVETHHDSILLAGPPSWPLVEILKKFGNPTTSPPAPPRSRK